MLKLKKGFSTSITIKTMRIFKQNLHVGLFRKSLPSIQSSLKKTKILKKENSHIKEILNIQNTTIQILNKYIVVLEETQLIQDETEKILEKNIKDLKKQILYLK